MPKRLSLYLNLENISQIVIRSFAVLVSFSEQFLPYFVKTLQYYEN